MITPPESTSCFYTAFFEKTAAQFVVGLLAESFSRNNDIEQALITSKDFPSDIECINELKNAVEDVSANIVLDDDEIEIITRFNPIFLPKESDLYDVVDLNDEGDVIAIDGFASPYITMSLAVSTDEMANIIEGKVIYRQFNLPPAHVTLETNMEPLLS